MTVARTPTPDAASNEIGFLVDRTRSVAVPDLPNRLTSSWADYDPAGNLTHFKFPGQPAFDWTAAYDGENKQRFFCADDSGACTSANADGEYRYDAGGNRVEKLTATAAITYVYDAFGKLAAEYSTQAPAGGDGTFYRTLDHLGSTRLVTDATGAVCSRHDYFPFGEQIPASATFSNRQLVTDGQPQTSYNQQCGIDQRFTAKERDDESGLDYFRARYFSASFGRFTSPDPKQFSSRTTANPQKWNRYAYVLNNPLALVDPDGREEITVTFRTFIPQKSVTLLGQTFAGDSRGFSLAATASSRSYINVRVETDRAVRADPIISINSGAGPTHRLDPSGRIVETAVAKTGLPTATATRDANGNVVLSIQQSVKNPLTPQFFTPAIDANLTVTVPQNASSAQVKGTADDFPVQELNVTRSDGNTTPVMRYQPAPGATPFALFPPDRTVNAQRATPTCTTDSEGKKVCNQ